MIKTLLRKFKISKKHLLNSIELGESHEYLFSQLNKLNVQERENLRESSVKILEQCLPSKFKSNNRQNNTGLVLGKIQSGKTLSFTSVIALAQDNGYKVVILISGRTNLLLKQTKDRLREEFGGNSKIKIHKIDKKTNFSSLLTKLIKPFTHPRKNKLNIIPILKHQDSLRKVSDLLSDSQINIHLKKHTVLIIDDESDQASLNTYARSNSRKNESNSSAIYSSIRSLRASCPNHTYLQYTATPQANLLVDSLSLLRPNWHVLLTPGFDYTGGNHFFKPDKRNPDLVAAIPSIGDYPPETKNLKSAPDSYIDAIKEFMMLSALMSGRIEGTNKVSSNASMLVHPTHRVNATKTNSIGIIKFEEWCINIKDDLESLIDLGSLNEFKTVYNKIKKDFQGTSFFPNFPSLDDIIEDIENNIIDEIHIERVTGNMLDKEEGYPWHESNYHILIGGALLDRGFTVNDLIMTYMPRDSKSNNQSDTIEQRCRFYGYKSKYLAFCRVYLNKAIIDDFKNYNEFEDYLHNYLKNHSLKEFYASGSKILMDKKLLPTNMDRISEPLINTHLSKWQYFELQAFSIDKNNKLITDFINNQRSGFKDLMPQNKVHRQDNYCHKTALVPITEIDDLLIQFETDSLEDTIKRDAIISYFEILQDNNGIENIWLIEMAPKSKRNRTIRSEKSKSGDDIYIMSSLQAGDMRLNSSSQKDYFGDRKLIKQTKSQSSEPFIYDDEPIIQLHKIYAGADTPETLKVNGKKLKGRFFYTFAIFFPEKYKRNFIQKR